MPDLNLDPNFFGHIKTKRLRVALGECAEVYPLRLFAYAAIHHPVDGKLIGYTTAEIESFMDWKGTEGVALEALKKLEWLDEIEGGFRIHDWKKHQGHLASYKARGRVAARARWAKLKPCNKHASSMPEGMQNGSSRNAPAKPAILAKPTELNEDRKASPTILSFLNSTANRSYRETETNLKLIESRLKEVGGDVEGVKLMIQRQCALWLGDLKMEEYLRPETLFGKSKFGGYYDNRNLPVPSLKKIQAATDADHEKGF